MTQEARPLTMTDLIGADDALDEFGPIPTQERVKASIAPGIRPAPAGALTPRQVNSITQARVRALCTDIVAGEMDRVKKALEDLAADNPKVYLDQLMAFMEFSTPKLKAMEIQHTGQEQSARELTVAELEAAMRQSVVSVQ